MNQRKPSWDVSIRHLFPSFPKFALTLCLMSAGFAGSLIGSVASLHAQDDGPSRRAAAHTQFEHAETMRATLEAKSERARSLQDYKDLVFAYRHVYLITPHAEEVPQALKEVGDLYRRMGQQFEALYFNSAVETYEFLLHEYPETRYREETLLAIADIERSNLAEPNLAEEAYKDFLSKYPHSTHASEASKALADMHGSEGVAAEADIPRAPAATQQPAATQTMPTIAVSGEAPSAASSSAASASAKPAAEQVVDAQTSAVSHIRIWNADTYTRIIIDLGGQAKYQTARIFNPDRIYFDIEDAKLSSSLLHNPINVPTGGYLKTVRVAQNRADVIRVVLEVSQVKDYSVFELANPDRLVVDVYGPNAQVSKVAPASEVPVEIAPAKPSGTTKAATLVSAKEAPAAAPIATSATPAPAKGKPATHAAPAPEAISNTSTNAAVTKTVSLPLESARAAAANIGPPTLPELTRAGTHSLTRALGLKISRIVIDAGHGGHDTGTIGPSGLMEKDLCLDVALRLGKIIQQNFPAAEVIYTRDDDTFVPLEQRTSIANQDKADLFLSIHANSSRDHTVNGIETYYLNFNASPEAMEVATRENALAQGSVHDLQDMVTKIAQNEKTEESRDFALDIQDSLAKHEDRTGTQERDRGVRKAPFVVLVGANMPSVLTEISFLSNPAEEQWLKKPDSRQHIAEGLYHGIQSYLQSTNSLSSSSNLPPSQKKVSSHAAAVVPSSDQE
jgi:N-acetylmuramoyl-L-alanine amidase